MATLCWFLISLLTMISGLHATSISDPGKPNISCIWHAKRNLICDFQVEDNTTVDQYNCSVCKYFSGIGPPNGTCPVKYDDGSCPVSTGRCLYDCVEHGYCRNSHMIKITVSGNRSMEPTSWCRLINTRKHLKPGPVRHLTLTSNTSTKVKVTWKKPNDRDNKEDGYRYIVYCPYNNANTREKEWNSSKAQETHYFGGLKPGSNYTISVKARGENGEYWSDLQTASVVTREDVPETGPFVPDGAFSVVDKDNLIIYWSMVPEGKRRGQIQNYSIMANSCLNTTVSSDTYFTTVSISQCGSGPLLVLTYASTRIGRSKKPFVRKLNPHLFDTKRVQSVHRSYHTLEWVYPKDKPVESFNVYWCYGNQDKTNPQLVKCRGALSWTTRPESTRTMIFESMDDPFVPCSLCSWQYAVSINTDNKSAGMVWNTPYPIVSTKRKEDTQTSGVIVTLALVAVLFLVVIFGIIIVLYKKQLICKRMIITVPELQFTDTSSEEDTYFPMCTKVIKHRSPMFHRVKAQKSKQEKLSTTMTPLLRDSGNFSMKTIRNQSGSSRRSLQCPPCVVEQDEVETYENMLSLNAESSHEVSSDQDCVLHHSEPTVEDDVWASPDTSAMSDYRQVACSENADPQGEEGVTVSSETTTDNSHCICSSDPVGLPHLHITTSTSSSLSKGSSPTHQSTQPNISRSDSSISQKLVRSSGTETIKW